MTAMNDVTPFNVHVVDGAGDNEIMAIDPEAFRRATIDELLAAPGQPIDYRRVAERMVASGGAVKITDVKIPPAAALVGEIARPTGPAELHAELLAVIDRRTDPAFANEFGALRAVVELHAPEIKSHAPTGATCAGDEFGGYDGEAPDWPCDTIVVIARALGEPYLKACPEHPDEPLFDADDSWRHRRDVHGAGR
jgi:hypothetical protein